MEAPRHERGRNCLETLGSQCPLAQTLPSASPSSSAPSPALPELPQPRLGALLHSPKSLHLAQKTAQVLRAPAAVVAAQRRHLQVGGTLKSESQETAVPPPPRFAGSCRPPPPYAARVPVIALGRARSSGAGTRRGPVPASAGHPARCSPPFENRLGSRAWGRKLPRPPAPSHQRPRPYRP